MSSRRRTYLGLEGWLMSGEVIFAGKVQMSTEFQVSRSVDFNKEIILFNVRIISGSNGYNDDMGTSIIGPPTDLTSKYPYVTCGSNDRNTMNGLTINGTKWMLQKGYVDSTYTAYVLILAIPRTDV